ncbi:YIP1 family protein [Natrialbaceae archaeon A-CW2]|uniref:YIP1 family protein n=1 Tax=Natronosalvus hydrolyticus TaxID=2979988 RepID=A0AAP3E5C5_9EURY|nr:YIP1 family protein [Natronosalvus amylolyticus]MCU4751241.1 YIP1 family protein [Halobacteria archaeon AArc-curdl1]
MLARLVTQPRYFFKEQTKYRGTRTQSMLVVAIGIAFALTHVGAYYQLGDTAIDLYEVIILHVALSLAVPFGIWLTSTILMAMVSRILSRGLLIGELFRLVGWGLYPLLVAGLIQSAGRLYAIQGTAAPELGLFSHLSYEWEQYGTYLETANNDPVFLVATLLAVAAVLYAGYLWTIAVKELSHFDNVEIATSTALIISAIPTTLCLLWIAAPFYL